MKVVPDTNVVLSASVWGGKPELLLEHARVGRIRIITSRPLLAELAEVVSRRKFAATLARGGRSPQRVISEYEQIVNTVRADVISRTVSDPSNDVVLGTAKAAQADLIVSGDRHLLTLRSFGGIPIVNVADALLRIEAAPL